MAQKPDYVLPFNDLITYVPQNLRNPVIKGLIDNLFNRQMTHDESIPFYGYIGSKPSSPDDKTPLIPQFSAERDINAIIPVLNFQFGTKTYAFTVQDLINKAHAIGITNENEWWLYSQSNNYLPPIDIDKFSNFFNYFWVAKAVAATPQMPWNTELLPEYYTIAQPADTDAVKLNVVAATTGNTVLTGTGFDAQTFTLTFVSPTEFTLFANHGLNGYHTFGSNAITAPGATNPMGYDFTLPAAVAGTSDRQTFEFNVTGPRGTFTLLTFVIIRDPIYDSSGNLAGNESFNAADTFTIEPNFLSPTYNVTFSGSAGVKGKISNVTSLNTYQTVDGVLLSDGQRVLVKSNSPATDNGIYIVGPGVWTRASDFSGSTAVAGAQVWVKGGTLYGGHTFVSTSATTWHDNGVTPSNTNDWQEGNFWASSAEIAAMGISRADVIQAVRPIIEFTASTQLNSRVSSTGVPTDASTGTVYQQVKTEFNQLPLFDLFRYDGTHSGLVSSLFFYVEDLTADLDLDLQKRVKISTNESADYLFDHGMVDLNGDLLFYKANGALKTIWHAGYYQPTVTGITFAGLNGDTKGSLVDFTPMSGTQQQVWTFTALTDTRFSVSGSKATTLPSPVDVINVGELYGNDDFTCQITAGTTAFEPGDSFIVRVGDLETPRYVSRDPITSAISDLYGGQAADSAKIGAYQVPRPFINNPYNEAHGEILEGTLYGHFRGILQNQIAGMTNDYAFGGSIKNWSEQQTLLASLLMQRDMTPISIIDQAQNQYEVGLNAIADIYKRTIAQYLTISGVVTPTDTAALNKLLDSILAVRAVDNDVRTVLYDTTSAVAGIPATLPQLGVMPLVQPSIGYNDLLGSTLLQHHDGHYSSLQADDLDFRRSLLNNFAAVTVVRSDGTETPAVGSFTSTEPVAPYRGELWIRPSTTDSTMYVFDVDFDTSPTSPVVGNTWYDRGSNVLSIWDGVHWEPQATHSQYWVPVNLADVLNQLMLLVEQRLYNGINPNNRKIDLAPLLADSEFNSQLQRELFTFAANNNLLPLASDYNPQDPFTWNYSVFALSDFAPLSTPTVPARWYNVLTAHQQTVTGVIPTYRPNLEPWKLLGFDTEAAWQATLSPAQITAYFPYATPDDLSSMISLGSVVAIDRTVGVTSMSGLPTVDGVVLSAGDSILLVNQTAPENNGVYFVSTGAWTRANLSYVMDSYITVANGVANKGTYWALTGTVTTIGTDPIRFRQVRQWSDQLWIDVQAARPTLKLSVDTVRDALLPPYVNPTQAQAVNGLTTPTVLPAGLSNNYQFGEGSIVETLWKQSIEYGYSIARALFRHDPLMFLGFCWGFNWVSVDGISYDGYDLNTPGHKRFRLHGDLNRLIPRSAANATITGTGPYTIVYDAYEVVGSNRYQNFSVRDANGIALGYVREGVPTHVAGSLISIDDLGQPFHIGDKFVLDSTGVTFVPATRYQYLGFGQSFTNALRTSAIDTSDSFAIDAFRNWDVNMGHRAGGLVATDDLTVRTDTLTLADSSFTLLFKKNELADDIWIQGLRITVKSFGASMPSADGSGTMPIGDGSDWVFYIEGYNPRYLNISYYDLITTGTYQTFNVLDQTATSSVWKQYLQHTSTIDTYLPLTITGVQNVVNFLFGYSDLMTDLGWAFNLDNTNNIDVETGRSRTWQLEVEKFIDRVYRGINLNQGHIVNPFMDQLWITQNTGLLSEFSNASLFDITGHSGVFDITGTKMNTKDLFVIRGNQQSQFGGTAPMYSAHAQLDEYEHLFIFKYYIEDSIQNGLLYDPFSGARVVTYKFDGRHQGTGTMRPEFGGHYLVGDEVRQNIQASTDNIARFYDANHVFENELTSRHALALLGFSTKQYFDDLDISDKSQFNFWRGLIKAKGTNRSIDAYLNNDRFADAKIDEYWAYKVATYGDSRQLTFPELKLNVNDSLQQFTQLQFDAQPGGELDNFTQISRLDESRWFSIDDLNQDAYFKAEVVGTYDATVPVGLVTLPFIADSLVIGGSAVATQLNATTIQVTSAGSLIVTGYGPATPRYNPVKLFNYVNPELVQEIPLWHPATGQHTPAALEAINIISTQNPAKYNFSTQVANNNKYDPLRPWGDNELGRVWLDTRNLVYIPYWDSTIFTNRAERLSRWGALADYGSIDVYEWVQSTVPPSEYNALAATQAGDADLDPATKAAGEVALQETYVRNRVWSIRPIAWSYSSVPTNTDFGSLPPFEISATTQLRLAGNGVTGYVVTLDWDNTVNSFSSVGISAGMHVGGWDTSVVPPKPTSEYIVNDAFTTRFVMVADGSDFPTNGKIATASTALPSMILLSAGTYSGLAGQLSFTPVTESIQRADANGALIQEWDTSVQVKLVASGVPEYVELGSYFGSTNSPSTLYGATITVSTGELITVTFPTSGIIVTVQVTAGGTYQADAIQQAIVTTLGSLVAACDAVGVTPVVSNSETDSTPWTNIPGDPVSIYGWRAWTIPTQAELDADGRQPVSSWKPYYGDFVQQVFGLADIQTAIAYEATPLTLNNGVIVQPYETTWADWQVLKNTVLTATQVSTGQLQLSNGTTNIDAASTSVYVNGIAQLTAAYTITGPIVLLSSVPAGSIATVIIRPYAPSAAELAFDPTVADDLTFQQQYKQDYEYVSLPVRDSEGALSSTIYYFWVKNKSTVALGKDLSVQSIAQDLRDGPTNFLTFQNLLAPTNTLPYRYDAITISGLSYIIAKDDTFKLRFTRNFTLRDDPQQIDLKDVHTEWSLIRPGQRTAIPESLWLKLTDSVTGEDVAGNPVPALRRTLYDERNGTTTQYGFGSEQTLGPLDLLVSTITYTIVNTKLINTSVPANPDGTYPADFIEFLDFSQSATWFSTPANARATMTNIWNQAKPAQINEIFFAALNDILATNLELTDIFKTSRLSAYSIKVVSASPVAPTYE